MMETRVDELGVQSILFPSAIGGPVKMEAWLDSPLAVTTYAGQTIGTAFLTSAEALRLGLILVHWAETGKLEDHIPDDTEKDEP